LGVNNTSREHEMPRDEVGNQLALREADNVDFSVEGKPRRRDGYALVGSGGHSAWSDDYLPFGLQVAGDALTAVFEDDSEESLVPGLAAGLPVSYARINDAVCWTNGVQSGQVTQGLEARPWACPNPPGPPMIEAAGNGALDAGQYQVTLTFLDAWGRESGAPRARPVNVAANGRILLTAIPQPPAGGRVRIYATSADDSILRAAATLDAGVTEFELAQPPQGRRCDTLGLVPLPPGQLVAYGNGRQFVAGGKGVLYSPALRYGMLDPRAARVAFARRVDMLAFVGDGTDGAGLYVSDGKRTYWLAGANPADWSQRIAYSTGAVPGQIALAPGEAWGLDTKQLLPVWQSRNGRLCVGLPGGKVLTPQPRENQVDAVLDQAERAALVYRDGTNSIVSALRGAGSQTFAMRDSLTVTEYRHDEA
jgi:hypothetical protein